jgi:hypothetical protein
MGLKRTTNLLAPPLAQKKYIFKYRRYYIQHCLNAVIDEFRGVPDPLLPL